jgi:hypothetical protein
VWLWRRLKEFRENERLKETIESSSVLGSLPNGGNYLPNGTSSHPRRSEILNYRSRKVERWKKKKFSQFFNHHFLKNMSR